jgi:hypothetical protein
MPTIQNFLIVLQDFRYSVFAGHSSRYHPMTIARSVLAPPGTEGCYHCVQRCVRRAFLCGEDKYSGRSFEHRKHWIGDRLRRLGDCFAIVIHAYAIMSNHLHLVIQIIPAIVAGWSDDEVATRWLRLFSSADVDEANIELKHRQLLANPIRLDVIRSRLGNLSWFMRCLAEPIARRANREDDCKGRFWEGRYRSQLLCDERAVLAAMSYVDLNPIRAGVCDRLDTSLHTSARERIEGSRTSPEMRAALLRPIIGAHPSATLGLSTADYLAILDWTGCLLAPGKRGKIVHRAPTILSRIDTPARWATRVRGYGSGWARAAGSAQDLMALAERLGQRWLKGVRLAIQLS